MSLFGRPGTTRSAANASKGARYRVADKNVRCLFCTNERFKSFGLGGARLTCVGCGYVMWFVKPAERLDD